MTRTNKVLSYVNEWHGGYWWLNTKEYAELPKRVAENVIAYHDLKENDANLSAYTAEARSLIVAGDRLKLVVNGSGWLALEVQE